MAPEPDPKQDGAWAFLAPADLSQHDLPSQAALGFHRGRTEELLNRAAATIERLSRELAESQRGREDDALARERLEVSLEEERKRTELLVGEAMVDALKAAQAIKAEAEADAEKVRAGARAQIGEAQEEAKLLVSEARLEAKKLVAAARAEEELLEVQTEQYKLLAAEVQRRSVGVLQRALEALSEGADADTLEDALAPSRALDQVARQEIPGAVTE
jgi:hypothetical protein